MIKIRSGLNGPIEFSVKSGNIKIFRSKIQGKPEFLTEITKKQYDELIADKTGPFKDLLKAGDFQVIKDHDDKEDSENRAFSMEELEAHSDLELEDYKTGEGAALLQSSLDTAEDALEVDFAGRLKEALENQKGELVNEFNDGHQKALDEQKESLESEAKTAKDEAVKVVKEGLVKRHNTEVTSGKLKKW